MVTHFTNRRCPSFRAKLQYCIPPAFNSRFKYLTGDFFDPRLQTILHHPLYTTMTSKFQEILEPAEAPTYTHPHLNVSLDDILREGRERSASQSSASSQPQSPHSGNESPKSPTEESKASSFRRRAFTLGSKKGRRAT